MRQRMIARLRRISIRRRPNVVMLLESVALFLITFYALYTSFNTVSMQACSSGQQLLYTTANQKDTACAEMMVLTKIGVTLQLGSYDDQRLFMLGVEGQRFFDEAPEDALTLDGQAVTGEITDAWVCTPEGIMLRQLYHTDSGLTACLFTPLSSLLVRSVRQPIDTLTGLCEQVQRENFTPVEDHGAADAMHGLIVSFHMMSAHIRQLIE